MGLIRSNHESGRNIHDRIAGSYGVDAPYVPTLFGVAALVSIGLGFAMSGARWAWWTVALIFLAQMIVYLNTTLSGKFLIWEEILDDLDLRGNEQALDVGCGRGMVLIETARRLKDGHATGIDLWRSHDQSGNDPERAARNVALNHVTDRVTLDTGDMTELPYADESFDLVTANVALQNVKDRQLRRNTIREILRVTRPGGRIRIVDVQYARQYRADLRGLGAEEVKLSGLGPRAWYGNPFFASELVSATLPR